MMLKAEKEILHNLFNVYDEEGFRDNFIAVHHMLDVEIPFQYNYESSLSIPIPFYNSQLSSMKKLEEFSNYKLIGFTSFDPFRFIDSNKDDIIRVLSYSLEEYKKYGFKFYPPMGFKPLGNKDERLDNVNNIFFNFCQDNDICIFTHCNEVGFEVTKGSGKNSNPIYWKEVLCVYKKLRLCFGHGGGGKLG